MAKEIKNNQVKTNVVNNSSVKKTTVRRKSTTNKTTKTTSNLDNTVVLKKKTSTKKAAQPTVILENTVVLKKKNPTISNNKNFVYDRKTNQIVTKKAPVRRKVETVNTLNNSKNNLSVKERNKQKYEQKQKKYRENTIQLRKITSGDESILEKKVSVSNKTKNLEQKKQARKKAIQNKEIKDKVEKKQNNKVKITKINSEKIKGTKRNSLEITLTNLKKRSIEAIQSVKEKVDDKNIPTDVTDESKNKRFRRYAIESIFYALIITIINVIAYFVFEKVNILRLFDVKWVNIVATILLSLVINYMVALLVDFLFTELWIKIKKHRGEKHGDNWVKRRKDKRNSQNKKGK